MVMISNRSAKIDDCRLSDRYSRTTGRVFLTGTQALARIMLDQARRDRVEGLNTAGFVSGYRGSPLGGLDMELWQMRDQLQDAKVEFMPAVNEDLGATAVLGAQQAVLDANCEVEGVFSMWYGKGPGVDRSGDALRHGNAYGSSPKGGVLVVAGDDHGCVSSSMPHQSDVAFMTWYMPTLNPASVEEFLAFGEYGIALSRFSGTWVGFKAISETVESGRSVELKPDRDFKYPKTEIPPGGLHVRRNDLPSPEIESRFEYKLNAVEAFVNANPIDQKIYDIKDAQFGIVTTGKGHLDLMEALRLLGLNEAKCRKLGIDIYKVGMVWPLARRDALAFVRGKKEVLVVEEKRGIIESQFKEYFYDWPGDKPAKMVGKHDANASRDLVPWTGELNPLTLVSIVAERTDRFFPKENLLDKADKLTKPQPIQLQVGGAARTPYFCSGCPHNTSTKVPDGSQAASGIGCHVMASWMDRETEGYAQMGGEGVPWITRSKFAGGGHIFQNLGEGTWYHSGSLAIRQAVASQTNITFKILYNDAVAMTGGQPVDGPISVANIAQSCRAEGVERLAIVSDDIQQFTKSEFPQHTTFDDRQNLDFVQRELREAKGVSVLIFEQACATEKRRRRKRGLIEDPKRFAYINPLVCEGCGDCSIESNCLSVEPRETEFGRKRQINLSSCNKDFSCLNGFCPSFVTVENAERASPSLPDLKFEEMAERLSKPQLVDLEQPYNLLVAGVGGTGVITIGALISMAAHLEGRGTSLLDFTGFAQKFGTVLSYIRFATEPSAINQVRLEQGVADAVIGCDIVVSSSSKASHCFRRGTQVALNTAEMPTGDLVLKRDASLEVTKRETSIRSAVGNKQVTAINANQIAEALLGNAVYANSIMLGLAWQKGMVPVGFEALDRAIVLNGVKVAENKRAFSIGRLLADDPDQVTPHLRKSQSAHQDLQSLVTQRAKFLTDYQNKAYADRYQQSIFNFVQALPKGKDQKFGTLAARSLFKLMAYKDEYEVARLHTQKGFEDELKSKFSGDFKIRYHLAPPLLTGGKDARGRPRKIEFGSWIRPALLALARLKFIRGTILDPFGYLPERKMQRDLIGWYESILHQVAAHESADEDKLSTILTSPMEMRGYGFVLENAVQEQKLKTETTLARIG
ncbi:MAG: indolepyruvate ferredoxin oxidoreductase family protein [Rhizobiaceae bacterium]|nr:indolepyruvate ferredoxin oxidoreductase family protein [Rhizobiaceae bacterium]